MKIYTKTGDDGTTGLFGGQRVRKDDVRVAAYGDVDETNAAIGLAAACMEDASAALRQIQHDLFTIGARLATPANQPSTQSIGDADVKRVEQSGLDSRADHKRIPMRSIGEIFATVVAVSANGVIRAAVWCDVGVGPETVRNP